MKLHALLSAALLLLACESSQNLGNPKPDGAASGVDGGGADKPAGSDARTGSGGSGIAGTGGASTGPGGQGGLIGAGGLTAVGGNLGPGGSGGSLTQMDAGTGVDVGTGTGGNAGSGGQAIDGGAGGSGGVGDAARDVPQSDAAGAGGVRLDAPGTGGTDGGPVDAGSAEAGGGAVDAPGTADAPQALAAPTRFVALPSAEKVQLTWVPPPDSTYAGSLLVRSTAPVDVTPAAGVTYASGDGLGSTTVLVAGDTASFLDTPLTNGTAYYYEVFAFTASHQYSVGVAASAVPHALSTRLPNKVGVGLQGFSGAIQDVELRYHAGTGYHMLVRSGASGAEQTVYYAQCGASCSTAASWTKTSLATLPSNYGAHLALDQQGMPRVVLGDSERTYRSCVAGCSSEASWSSVTLPGGGLLRGVAVDTQNQVWVVSAGSSSTPSTDVVHCASGCTNAANWTVTAVLPGVNGAIEDFSLGPSGQMAILHFVGTSQRMLRLASCASGCGDTSAWSIQSIFNIGGYSYDEQYRILSDGQGARLFAVRNASGVDHPEYHACDTCAPGVPPLLLELPSPSVRSFDVNEQGQPRFLTGTDASGYDLYYCDLGCDLADNWTAAEVIPGYSPGYNYGVIRLQVLPDDRPILIIGSDSGAVALQGAAAPDGPPAW